jgi:hypothetical protein
MGRKHILEMDSVGGGNDCKKGRGNPITLSCLHWEGLGSGEGWGKLLFLFLVGLGLELRASHLQSRLCAA